MTKKEKETVLKAVETAYYRAYKDEKSPLSMWASATTLTSLAIDLGIDVGMVFYRKKLAKVAALGMKKTA